MNNEKNLFQEIYEDSMAVARPGLMVDPGPNPYRVPAANWTIHESGFDAAAQRDELKKEVERLREENRKLSDLAVKATESLHALLMQERDHE